MEALLILWFLFGLAAALIANAKGRSGCGWFALGFFLGPFGLIVALLPSREQKEQQLALKRGVAGDYRKCPFCAEPIRREAVKCKHCGSPVTPDQPAAPLNKRCPDCAHLNPETAKVCSKCGRRFSW